MSYLASIGAIMPVDARGPAVYSTDTATYGAFHKHQIPSIAKAGGRWFMANYGGILPEAEESGEAAGCYARLKYSDSATIDSNTVWTSATFWRPDVVTNSGQQPQLGTLEDGRLLVFYVYGGTGGFNRTIWATILTNPSAAPASWSWTRNAYAGVGFVGPPRYLDGVLCYTAYEVTGGNPTQYEGNRFKHLLVNDTVPEPVEVGVITDVSDPELLDFYETSIVRLANGAYRALFRTETTQYYSDSLNRGVTWGPALPFTLVNTVSSRCDWVNLPDGKIALAYNESTTTREKMTLAILSSDASTVLGKVLIDSRGASAPHPSYPNIFVDPTDTEHLYCAWDCGRGRQNPPTNTNEIIVARINIADATSNVLTMTSSVITS